MRDTRPISWIKAAKRDFENFPEEVQGDMLNALTIAAEGSKSDKAKPFKGVEGGVFEIALKHRGEIEMGTHNPDNFPIRRTPDREAP